jgi:hypothetical protein
MAKATLRSLFAELPWVDEEVLLQATGESSMLNGLRQKDQYVVVHHSREDGFCVKGVPTDNLSLLKAELEDEGCWEFHALYLNGNEVKFRLKKTVEIEFLNNEKGG